MVRTLSTYSQFLITGGILDNRKIECWLSKWEQLDRLMMRMQL